uniref:Secreted protein n=1 Tax=Anopheles merus TaxID=30066 RepID=A0A182V1S4_ANOME
MLSGKRILLVVVSFTVHRVTLMSGPVKDDGFRSCRPPDTDMKNPYSSTLNMQFGSSSLLSFSSVHRSNTHPVRSGSGTGICQLNSNFFVMLPSARPLRGRVMENVSSRLPQSMPKVPLMESFLNPSPSDRNTNARQCLRVGVRFAVGCRAFYGKRER